jgi:hypothetical protein
MNLQGSLVETISQYLSAEVRDTVISITRINGAATEPGTENHTNASLVICR